MQSEMCVYYYRDVMVQLVMYTHMYIYTNKQIIMYRSVHRCLSVDIINCSLVQVYICVYFVCAVKLSNH